jgi:hypothetical protein
MPWPRRRPSTLGNRRRKRTQATRTSLAHPRATTRRGKWIILSMQWNDHGATRSISTGWVNFKASWIASTFSTPRESIRAITMTKGTDQVKKPEESKGDFPDSYESRRKQKLTAREVMAVSSPPPPSTLSGPRSPSPSTAMTTQTLYRS